MQGGIKVDNSEIAAIFSSFMGAFVCIVAAIKVMKDKEDDKG